jgi:hypothetical protein
MPGTRVAKTFEKIRAGELPAPHVIKKFLAGGLGKECSGCGEMIGRTEQSYYVQVGDGALLRFHLVCHETWIRFKRWP